MFSKGNFFYNGKINLRFLFVSANNFAKENALKKQTGCVCMDEQ